jgi:hypothetical protein
MVGLLLVAAILPVGPARGDPFPAPFGEVCGLDRRCARAHGSAMTRLFITALRPGPVSALRDPQG